MGNKEIINPPQCMHLDFTADGLVKEFGFYTVDRRQGNTGGLGGAFAFFYGVGRSPPFRKCTRTSPRSATACSSSSASSRASSPRSRTNELRPIHVSRAAVVACV